MKHSSYTVLPFPFPFKDRLIDPLNKQPCLDTVRTRCLFEVIFVHPNPSHLQPYQNQARPNRTRPIRIVPSIRPVHETPTRTLHVFRRSTSHYLLAAIPQPETAPGARSKEKVNSKQASSTHNPSVSSFLLQTSHRSLTRTPNTPQRCSPATTKIKHLHACDPIVYPSRT
ncbi:hypothetical protein BKA81DRAFT_15493 [Phyllosticta paracitricarpa]